MRSIVRAASRTRVCSGRRRATTTSTWPARGWWATSSTTSRPGVAGCRTVLLDVGHETQWRLSSLRLRTTGGSEPGPRCRRHRRHRLRSCASGRDARPSTHQLRTNMQIDKESATEDGRGAGALSALAMLAADHESPAARRGVSGAAGAARRLPRTWWRKSAPAGDPHGSGGRDPLSGGRQDQRAVAAHRPGARGP